MKTTIKKTAANEVTLTCENDYYDIVTLKFNVPSNGGYVRDQNGCQVCKKLKNTGFTLESTPDDLLRLIRAEYRAMMAEKRKMKRN